MLYLRELIYWVRKMARGGFDKIAKVYDGLARMVFGKSTRQAQLFFLNEIQSTSRVLILGGGTGWLLVHLLKIEPQCEVWYIEASSKMLELSKEKTKHSNRVHFIHGTENDIPSKIKFDVVIASFYFDLFTDASLDSVVRKIQQGIKSDALWLVTDFINGKKWWQRTLLKIMYLFFQITCGIESSKLPDWNQQLQRMGLVKVKSKFFFMEFIEATLYGAQ